MNKPSNDECLSVDFWIFTHFWLSLLVGHIKLFCTSKNQKQFCVPVPQIFSNLGKFSEINKQFHVKSWLTYWSYSSVWWILSCIKCRAMIKDKSLCRKVKDYWNIMTGGAELLYTAKNQQSLGMIVKIKQSQLGNIKSCELMYLATINQWRVLNK